MNIKNCKGLKSITGLMFSDADGALIYANSLWMPFVKHKLDLFFLNDEFKIIDIQHATPLTMNPKTWKVYENRNAKYCLEAREGLFDNKINDFINIKTLF